MGRESRLMRAARSACAAAFLAAALPAFLAARCEEDRLGMVAPPPIDVDALARELGLPGDDVLVQLLKADERELTYSRIGLDLAKEIYPDMDAAAIGKQIDEMAAGLKKRIGEETDGRKIVRIFNRYFYEELRFHAPRREMKPNDEDPDDYFPNKVIERREGVCLGLTLVYLILAERASLPIRGVASPMHIFAKYDDGKIERNIECTNLGVEIPDYGYMMQNKMSFRQAVQGRYFRPVSKKIVLGDLLNAIAWCSATGSAKNRLPPKRAVAYARACCIIDPSKYNNWDTLAEAYYYAGDFDRAVEMMDKTMSMDPPYTPPFDKAYYEKQRKKYADAKAAAKPEKPPENAPEKAPEKN